MPITRAKREIEVFIVVQTIILSGLILVQVYLFRKTPSDVYMKVDALESALRTAVQTYRSDMGSTRKDIEQLRKQLKDESERLRIANERLIHLDPNFKPPPKD